LIEKKSIDGIIINVNVTIIDLNDKGPVITFLLKSIKLSAGQLSK